MALALLARRIVPDDGDLHAACWSALANLATVNVPNTQYLQSAGIEDLVQTTSARSSTSQACRNAGAKLVKALVSTTDVCALLTEFLSDSILLFIDLQAVCHLTIVVLQCVLLRICAHFRERIHILTSYHCLLQHLLPSALFEEQRSAPSDPK